MTNLFQFPHTFLKYQQQKAMVIIVQYQIVGKEEIYHPFFVALRLWKFLAD